jgi:hypothetical protein
MTLNVTFKRPSLEMAMEVGSLKELAGYIQEEGTQLSKIFGDDLEMVVRAVAGDTALASGTVGEAGPEIVDTTKPKPRGRPAKDKSQPDPSTANAPAPLPIPPAPELAAQNAAAAATGDIPEYLKRPAADAPPPPPPPPPAPPVAPPSGILAGKVIGALDARATNDEAKVTLAKWLSDYRLVNPGSSYDESIAAVRLMPDDKLAQVATALAVA